LISESNIIILMLAGLIATVKVFAQLKLFQIAHDSDKIVELLSEIKYKLEKLEKASNAEQGAAIGSRIGKLT